jgi:hypothetical protein
MKSIKLNETNRQKIKYAATKLKFKKEDISLNKKEKKLGDKVYKLLYTPYLKKMNELPKDAFYWSDRIHIKNISLHPSAKNYQKENEIYLIMNEQQKQFYHNRTFGDICIHGLPAAVVQGIKVSVAHYLKMRKDHKGRKTQFHYRVRNLLYQVNTTKQLIELLPEAEVWVKEALHKECTDLPAADIAAQISNM